MRKLVIFCFAVCMTVLTVLSLFDFAQDAEKSMILDKRAGSFPSQSSLRVVMLQMLSML